MGIIKKVLKEKIIIKTKKSRIIIIKNDKLIIHIKLFKINNINKLKYNFIY